MFGTSRNLRPRYCPACRRRRQEFEAICPGCGERTHERGYCAVCEGHADAAVGVACPKHGLELLPTPSQADCPESIEPGRWVTIRQFAYPALAIAPRLRLESEGIPTFLDGERVASEVAYTLATGGVRLQVPETMSEQARAILGIAGHAAEPRPAASHQPLGVVALAAVCILGATLFVRWLIGG